MDAVAVRWECRYRRGAAKSVVAAVFVWEISLPCVGQVLPTRGEFATPGELGAVQSATRGEFPFGLGWQILAGPFGKSERIAERHMHDGVIVEDVDVALRSVRMSPVGTPCIGPPRAEVFQID